MAQATAEFQVSRDGSTIRLVLTDSDGKMMALDMDVEPFDDFTLRAVKAGQVANKRLREAAYQRAREKLA